jgi:hypothetical protein
MKAMKTLLEFSRNVTLWDRLLDRMRLLNESGGSYDLQQLELYSTNIR